MIRALPSSVSTRWARAAVATETASGQALSVPGGVSEADQHRRFGSAPPRNSNMASAPPSSPQGLFEECDRCRARDLPMAGIGTCGRRRKRVADGVHHGVGANGFGRIITDPERLDFLAERSLGANVAAIGKAGPGLALHRQLRVGRPFRQKRA
ncbi:MAG: hypothetical protein WAT70_00410 [Rhizobiaceae bacterium]